MLPLLSISFYGFHALLLSYSLAFADSLSSISTVLPNPPFSTRIEANETADKGNDMVVIGLALCGAAAGFALLICAILTLRHCYKKRKKSRNPSKTKSNTSSRNRKTPKAPAAIVASRGVDDTGSGDVAGANRSKQSMSGATPVRSKQSLSNGTSENDKKDPIRSSRNLLADRPQETARSPMIMTPRPSSKPLGSASTPFVEHTFTSDTTQQLEPTYIAPSEYSDETDFTRVNSKPDDQQKDLQPIPQTSPIPPPKATVGPQFKLLGKRPVEESLFSAILNSDAFKATGIDPNAILKEESKSRFDFKKPSSSPDANKTVVPGTDTTVLYMNTVVNVQKELSIPGYLELEPDKDFEMTEMIAQGGFGVIFLGELKNAEAQERVKGSRCVVKTFDQDKVLSDEQYMLSFTQEVSMMCYFTGNKYFVQIAGFTQTPPAIVMRYYQHGSLDKFVTGAPENKPWDSQTAMEFACDIAHGLEAMHQAGFVHCDIKPANILIDRQENNQWVAVLSDLGGAKVVNDNSMLVLNFKVSKLEVVSLIWAAPEMLLNEKAPDDPASMKATDVYSYAMVLYFMLTKQNPWSHFQRKRDFYVALKEGLRPAVSPEIQTFMRSDIRLNGLHGLMVQCWSNDARMRPTMENVLKFYNRYLPK